MNDNCKAYLKIKLIFRQKLTRGTEIPEYYESQVINRTIKAHEIGNTNIKL